MTKRSILFVHGAFAGAWCWDEYFVPWFEEQGYEVRALDLPGRRYNEDHDRLQEYTILDYTAAVIEAIDAFSAPPIVVGHSMGGYLAWRAAEMRRLDGLVLMAPVPPTGLAAPAMQLLVSDPGLYFDVAKVHAGGDTSLKSLHKALFSSSMPIEDVIPFLRRFQSESQLAVLGMYAGMFPNVMAVWGTPVKVIGAAEDPLIPSAHVHWTASLTGTAAHIYEDMGHGMMLEPGWAHVAQDIADWLVDRNLSSHV